MNDREQIDAFARELENLISRYAEEFNLSTAATIGALEIQKHALIANALNEEDESS